MDLTNTREDNISGNAPPPPPPPVPKSDESISPQKNTNGLASKPSTDGSRTPNVEVLSKTNLYIRGLSTNTTDQTLYSLCSQFGDITSTKAIQDKITGTCKGYGFVQFSNPRSAEVAVQELIKSGVQAQMARIPTPYSFQNQYHAHHNVHHNHFHSMNNGNQSHHHHHHNGGLNNGSGYNNGRNSTSGQSQSANNVHNNINNPDPTNLYIANLPVEMSEQELEDLLSEYGPVVSTRILRDIENRSRGVGFARMESRDKCQEIIDQLNGKPYKGSSETLLVKFADGGAKKRHQHGNHHHNNHYSLHQRQQHKPHRDDKRNRDSGNTSGDNSNVSSFDQQSNISHGNQMSDLTMMGYHRLQPTFPPMLAPGAPYTGPHGPNAGAPQWIHPGGPGQPWNIVHQHMIPTSGLGPPNQAAAMFHSQLASQMQALQISHHPTAPMPEGYVQQWPPVWPNAVQPQPSNQPHSA